MARFFLVEFTLNCGQRVRDRGRVKRPGIRGGNSQFRTASSAKAAVREIQTTDSWGMVARGNAIVMELSLASSSPVAATRPSLWRRRSFPCSAWLDANELGRESRPRAQKRGRDRSRGGSRAVESTTQRSKRYSDAADFSIAGHAHPLFLSRHRVSRFRFSTDSA